MALPLLQAKSNGIDSPYRYVIFGKGLSGATLPALGELPYFGKDGNPRHEIRVRRWLKPDSERTIADTVFPPDPTLPNTRFSTPNQWEPYDLTEPPVIFGHCWLPKDWPPAPIMPNVICVDYSAGKGGPLVAYSFDPEKAREGEFTSAE